jgi:hypothetical protein
LQSQPKRRILKFFSHAKRKRIDKFNMKVQFDSETDRDKNRQCITSGIKHWGLSGYSSILPRIKFGVTGQDNSPQSPTISYRQPLAASVRNRITN